MKFDTCPLVFNLPEILSFILHIHEQCFVRRTTMCAFDLMIRPNPVDTLNKTHPTTSLPPIPGHGCRASIKLHAASPPPLRAVQRRHGPPRSTGVSNFWAFFIKWNDINRIFICDIRIIENQPSPPAKYQNMNILLLLLYIIYLTSRKPHQYFFSGLELNFLPGFFAEYMLNYFPNSPKQSASLIFPLKIRVFFPCREYVNFYPHCQVRLIFFRGSMETHWIAVRTFFLSLAIIFNPCCV